MADAPKRQKKTSSPACMFSAEILRLTAAERVFESVPTWIVTTLATGCLIP